MFNAEMIQARVRSAPFIPFRVVTSSGEAYDVAHPELMVGIRSVEIGVPKKPGSTIYDQVFRVSLLHITALNDLPVAVSGSGNGAA